MFVTHHWLLIIVVPFKVHRLCFCHNASCCNISMSPWKDVILCEVLHRKRCCCFVSKSVQSASTSVLRCLSVVFGRLFCNVMFFLRDRSQWCQNSQSLCFSFPFCCHLDSHVKIGTKLELPYYQIINLK